MARAARINGSENDALALRVREEMARRRMSREGLAAEARISLSTLEKALAGTRPFTLATIVRLEETLGVRLRPAARIAPDGTAPGLAAGVAPADLGGYSRASIAWLEGSFLTIRPSFGGNGAIYAYRTDIAWDDEKSCLAFREAERIDTDFTQFGVVSVPHQSAHVYLVTNRHGQHRMIVLARPVITGEMHGLLTTLLAGRGAHLSPVAAPIILKPMRSVAAPAFGRVLPGQPSYAAYSQLLAKTLDQGFATLLAK